MEKADAFLDRLLKMPAFMKAEEFKTNGDHKFVLKVLFLFHFCSKQKQSNSNIPFLFFLYKLGTGHSGIHRWGQSNNQFCVCEGLC